MAEDIFYDGAKFILASRAAAEFDLHRDYISRLAREGKILGKLVGRIWYVHESSLKSFIIQRAYEREVRKEALSLDRARQYKAAQSHSLSETTEPRFADMRSQGEAPIKAQNTTVLKENDEFTDSLEEKISPASRSIHAFLNAPTGLTHAAIQTSHSAHFVSPAMELVHKLIALTFAVSLTFGTFALLNPEASRVAEESLQQNLVRSYDLMKEYDIERTKMKSTQSAAVEAADVSQSIDSLIGMFGSSIESVLQSMALPKTSLQMVASGTSGEHHEIKVSASSSVQGDNLTLESQSTTTVPFAAQTDTVSVATSTP